MPEHGGIWAGALVLFFLAGHRLALRRLPLPAQLDAYFVVVLTYVVSMAGVIDLWAMTGLTRYVLVAAPAFLAVGAVLKHAPAALAACVTVPGGPPPRLCLVS